MREIKFRAWDRITRKMHDGNAIIGPRADMSVITAMPSIFRVNEFFFELSKSLTLMQFTGLKDKNGKEILKATLSDFRSARYIDGEQTRRDVFLGMITNTR